MTAVALGLTLGGKPVTFQMDDCDRRDYVVAQASHNGLERYEAPYPRLLAAIIAAVPGDMLDIGANTGLYSLLAAASRDDVRVHAFEPLGPIADVFDHNLALNPGLSGRIDLVRLALSDREGEAVFFEPINPYGLMPTSSSLDEPFARTQGITREHLIRTRTLDTWISEAGVREVSFIKLDVEAHEPRVLAGATDTVMALRPIIGVEMLGDADFAYFRAFLDENAYADCAATPDGIAVGQTPEFIVDGWNHLLVPMERLPLVAHLAAQAGLPVS